MKKILFIVLIFSFVFVHADLSRGRTYLKFASWNIRILSDGSRTDTELAAICRVAKNFDLLVIQELRDEKIMQRMVAMLKKNHGKTYAYKVSSPVGGGVKELYGFVYDSSFVRCTKNPYIYNDSFFLRKPCVASFKAEKFDFTVITTHIIWGSSTTQRKKEIQRMASVFEKVQNKDRKENDVILVGDFNRNPDDDVAWGNLKSIYGMHQVFQLPQKSMIKDTHCYDNILFQSTYLREWTGYSKIYHFDETDFGNNDEKASEYVSDHRPVSVRFRITSDDD